MIAYLEGRLLAAGEDSCVLVAGGEGGGVGYEVHLPGHALAALPAPGERLALHCFTVVREDAIELYGFPSPEERAVFAVLISISKVGPKLATAILGVFRPQDLARLIADEDVSGLTRVSGIGKKTAQHIFLELKYKLKIESVPGHRAAGSSAAGPGGGVLADALAALANLGYQEEETRPVLSRLLEEEPDLDVSQALREALKRLAKA